MNRTAFHRPADLPTPPLDLEDTIVVAAPDLQVGDVIVQRGFIPLSITDVRQDISELVVAEYRMGGDYPGTRIYATSQKLTVRRLAIEAL